MNKLRGIPSTISRSSLVTASAIPDNWCQKWDVRREDASKKTTMGAAEKQHAKYCAADIYRGRHLPRPTSTYTAAIVNRDAENNSLL